MVSAEPEDSMGRESVKALGVRGWGFNSLGLRNNAQAHARKLSCLHKYRIYIQTQQPFQESGIEMQHLPRTIEITRVWP